MTTLPTFFAKPVDLRKWFAKNHKKANALWVGFHKRATAKASITWPESVDEALCYGWIDGIRKSLGEDSYMIRFTPRRRGSFWSNKNIASAQRLTKAGRMKPAGLKAFMQRKGERSGVYSFEQTEIADFEPGLAKKFQANKKAWSFFSAQPPGYQKTIRHWITSAKQADTRLKRLNRLIEVSAQKERLDLLAPFGKKVEK